MKLFMRTWRRLAGAGLILGIVFVLLIKHTGGGFDKSVIVVVSVISAVGAGWILAGKSSVLSCPVRPIQSLTISSVNSPEAPCEHRTQASRFRDIIQEVSHLQCSEDLLERYQSFVRLVEDSFTEILGPCAVSLWCRERNGQSLVECINPINSNRTGDVCRVTIDSDVIQNVLNHGDIYFAGDSSLGRLSQTNPPPSSLRFDGCFALYRPYGQPLVVIVERTGSKAVESLDKSGFYSTVALVKLFWQDLQAVNQREWLAVHDQGSGALRDDAFIQQGQQLATQCCQRDELFSLALITLHGFRRMFAGQADRWRLLSNVFGRCLTDILREKGETFLLGKTADDIFALLVLRKDEFLTRQMMDVIMDEVSQRIKSELINEDIPLAAIEIQWCCSDHRSWRGTMEEWLNRQYQSMFGKDYGKNIFSRRIMLGKPEPQEVA